uniref:Secreted protein n=1 Tax=Phakopsora pachyrhizi TaxID=170000 RepID=A0A0S1MK25_PHAPC
MAKCSLRIWIFFLEILTLFLLTAESEDRQANSAAVNNVCDRSIACSVFEKGWPNNKWFECGSVGTRRFSKLNVPFLTTLFRYQII